jgi:hypothetical protein
VSNHQKQSSEPRLIQQKAIAEQAQLFTGCHSLSWGIHIIGVELEEVTNSVCS